MEEPTPKDQPIIPSSPERPRLEPASAEHHRGSRQSRMDEPLSLLPPGSANAPVRSQQPNVNPVETASSMNPGRARARVILGIVGLLILGLLVWLGLKGYSIASKIIVTNTGNRAPFFAGNVDANALRGEGDGRINILLIGIGGEGHKGGQLADTIMVASIDPINKSVALLSIPRDLYVEIPGNSWAKINHAHAYGQEKRKNGGSSGEAGGPDLLKQTVAGVLDLPIHYYVRMDFQGFKKIVDVLGGVGVNVEKPINDPLYPDKALEGYEPFYLPAGYQVLNGEVALKFARSRQTSSDFDRAKRQQQLLQAIEEKAISLNVLANPKKVFDILEILGNHVRTDLRLREIERMLGLAKDFRNAQVINHVFDTAEGGPLTSMTAPDGGYIIIPRLGQGNYQELQRIAHEIFTDPYLTREQASIEVHNGSATPGAAVDLADYLKSYGYKVTAVKKASQQVSKTIIYDYSRGQKTVTLKFLSKRLNASVIVGKSGVGADFVIVVGDDYIPGVLKDTEQSP